VRTRRREAGDYQITLGDLDGDRVVEAWESTAKLCRKRLHRLHTTEIAGIIRIVMLMVDVVWSVDFIGGIQISCRPDANGFPGQALVLFGRYCASL
jgi:hypothetical protein